MAVLLLVRALLVATLLPAAHVLVRSHSSMVMPPARNSIDSKFANLKLKSVDLMLAPGQQCLL